MILTKSKKITKKTNLILLSDEKTSFKDFNLSDEEEKFVKKSHKEENNIIEINQYDRYVYAIFVEKSNTTENLEKTRKLANKVYSSLKSKKISEITLINACSEQISSISFLEGLMLSNYSFTKYFTKEVEKKQAILAKIKIKDDSVSEKDLQDLETVIESVFITRDLVNEPYSGLNSVDLSNRIIELSKQAGFSVEVLYKKQIEALKMGGLLAVNKASDIPPTFSILEWKPKNSKNKKPLILVGKGVVFDTGGYSLKPGIHMTSMKSDMAGAAAVVGIMHAVAKLELPIHVIGLIPATDNLIGKDAYVVDDVIKMHNGMTVEILNTDAEGRLILADALSYAQKYSPELVIDMATLTGAAVVAVGTISTVIMSKTNRKTTAKILKSAKQTDERLIEFPLWEEYGEGLKSKIADIKNLGNKYAGHVSAAKFLEHFTDYPWIHLDIAPTAFLDSKRNYRGVGATGVPVRLLVNFIQNYI